MVKRNNQKPDMRPKILMHYIELGGAEIPTGIPPIINIDETMKAIYELFG